MKTSNSSGGIIQNSKSNKIAIVNQRGRSWSFPKGHIEEGENSLDCAKREVYEETGLEQIEFVKRLGKYERYKLNNDGTDDKSEVKIIELFLFSTDSQDELQPIDAHNPEARWVSIEEAMQLLTHEKDRDFLKIHSDHLFL